MTSRREPGKPAAGGIRQTGNPYWHARSLSGWRREILQLSPGNFTGVVREVCGAGFCVAEESLSCSAFHVGPAYPEGLTLGVLQEAGATMLWNGVRIGADCLVCAFGDLEMLLRSDRNARLCWLSVPQSGLADYPALRAHAETRTQAAALFLESGGLAQAVRTCVGHFFGRGDAGDSPGGEGLAAMTPRSEDRALAIAEAFQREYLARLPVLAARESHAIRVVRAVRQHLRENPGASVNIPDLCAIAATSERTLRNASEIITGESPITFLRAMRLNQVHRCLLAATSPVRITEIGMRWGFLHMPQFSKDYRNLFGELPSETIRRQLNAVESDGRCST